MRPFLLLLMTFATATCFGQTWKVGTWTTMTNSGCFIPGQGQPRKDCYQYWSGYIQLTSADRCSGVCSVRDNALGCSGNPDMKYKKHGPDLHTQTISIAPANGAASSNIARVRGLKCIEKGSCKCIWNQEFSRYFCRYDILTKSFYSANTYEVQLNGPACPNPNTGGSGGGTGGPSDDSGGSGSGGGSGGPGPTGGSGSGGDRGTSGGDYQGGGQSGYDGYGDQP